MYEIKGKGFIMNNIINDIKYGPDGLVTAVVVDLEDAAVLMVAYMNAESLKRTLETGKMTYWSRSRQKFWVKGESSGNVQIVKEIRVEQKGRAACHAGYRSCFYRKLDNGQWLTDGEKVFNPDEVYNKGP